MKKPYQPPELREIAPPADAPSWDDSQVMALIAERDAAREALRGLVLHLYPTASPAILERFDAPWKQAAVVLWGPREVTP